jgi:hypothetical protein
MLSSISSSDPAERIALDRPGFVRLTASDRPGVAQPVPERDIPAQPWPRIFAAAMALMLVALGAWEWRMRALGLEAGDLDDGSSAWAEQRRRIDTENVPVAIVGDSRILFDTNLDRFEALTGVRPVQLALAGTNARPFLENLADDPDFKGIALVGIAETSYFRDAVGLNAEALKRYRFESPSVRVSYLLHRALSRVFAFLDGSYRLSRLVHQADEGWRAGVATSIPDRIWKLAVTGDDRQTSTWPRVESDARVREHQRAVWGLDAPGPVSPIDDAVVTSTQEKTRAAVAKIRARSGEVMFLRPPSSPEFRKFEDVRAARARVWDALLTAADVRGIHSDDEPAMQGLDLPEYSHLSRACATVFTDAYARALARVTPRIALRSDAPPALKATDCVAVDARVTGEGGVAAPLSR